MTHELNSVGLTDTEKVNVRRYCWYPSVGDKLNINTSWPYFSKYGDLEYKIGSLSVSEIEVVRSMLATLTCLEQGPARAAQNLDTDKASVWTRNQSEVRDRVRLYEQQRGELVRFLGVAPGPGWNPGGVRFVV